MALGLGAALLLNSVLPARPLFRAIVDHVLVTARAQIVDVDVSDCRTGEEAVRRIAEKLAASLLTPRVQRLRRLIIAEAARFPDIGLAYYEGAFQLTLAGIARVLDGLVQRGLLRIDDTGVAANQLAGLTLWLPTNRIMMTGRLDSVSQAEIDAAIESGVRVFLAAYEGWARSIRATLSTPAGSVP